MSPPKSSKNGRSRAATAAEQPTSSVLRDLQEAVQNFQAGQFGHAEASCRRVLQTQPGHADALHVLGLIAWRSGKHRDAIDAITQAVAGRPHAPQFHNSLGVVFKSCGDLQAAAVAFRKALELNPNYPEALTNLGNVLRDLGRLEEAESAHRQALKLAPRYAEGHSNLATVLSRRGRPDEAIVACQTALELQPGRAELHSNLGNALATASRFEEAIRAYRRAVELAADCVDAHANLGLALHRLGRFEEAGAAHRAAIALRPTDARVWLSLGGTLVALDRPDEALGACMRAVDLDPDLPEAYNNLGMVLKEQGKLSDAIAAYQTAIRLRPGYPEAHNNLGVALNAAGRFAEALAAYGKALALDPDYADAHWNKGLLHLLLGDFEAGWRAYGYGWRVAVGRGPRRHGRYPAWAGAPVAGRTILAWSEQGVGDQIMFASLLPDLIAQGATCVVEVDARLEPLLRRSIQGLKFIPRDRPESPEIGPSAIDYQVPFGGLCRWLRVDLTGFPSRPGFLRADDARVDTFRRRYRDRFEDRRIVGISWRGGSGQPGRSRSIPLAAWLPILSRPDLGFVNLQYGDCQAELAALRKEIGVEIFHDTAVDPLKSLDDFAAQTAAMDLVISIDNSTVHMGGALNVPVWVLLPAVPDWRWMLNRSDSPWYSSVRLFRQATPGEWSPVIAAVADELKQVIGGEGGTSGNDDRADPAGPRNKGGI